MILDFLLTHLSPKSRFLLPGSLMEYNSSSNSLVYVDGEINHNSNPKPKQENKLKKRASTKGNGHNNSMLNSQVNAPT